MSSPIWERGQEGGKTRPINRDSLFKNLVEVCKTLDRHGIKYCLSHGTALGAYREDNFIEWDDDADIALDLKDRAKIYSAADELRKAGYFIPQEGEEGMPWYDTVFIKDGEKIEGWWFEKFDSGFYIYDFPRCGNKLKHPERYYDEPQDYVFRGHVFKIPNHIEDYLVMMYGGDWKIPQKGKKYNDQT